MKIQLCSLTGSLFFCIPKRHRLSLAPQMQNKIFSKLKTIIWKQNINT